MTHTPSLYHFRQALSVSASSSNESLVAAFFLTVLIHSAIIFGITFSLSNPPKPKISQTLDIVLVKTETKQPPETPDFLAQADQVGGGNTRDKAKPTSKNPGEKPTQGNAFQNKPKVAPTPVVQKTEKKSVLSTTQKSSIKAPKLVKQKKPMPKKSPDLVADYIADLQQQIIDSNISKLGD